MTDLQKITTEVTPTSLNNPQVITEEIRYSDTLSDLQSCLKLYGEYTRSFEEGIFSEKNKNTHISKIFVDIISFVLEQDDPKIDNPNELNIHKQNKKFIKDSLILLMNNIKNYNIDEKKVKLMLTGKLIQSLYESKN